MYIISEISDFIFFKLPEFSSRLTIVELNQNYLYKIIIKITSYYLILNLDSLLIKLRWLIEI